jgi:hypothetical protein
MKSIALFVLFVALGLGCASAEAPPRAPSGPADPAAPEAPIAPSPFASSSVSSPLPGTSGSTAPGHIHHEGMDMGGGK